MKLRYIPLLAVALVFGCSKPAPSGNTASNAPDTKSAVTTGSTSTTGSPSSDSSLTTGAGATGSSTPATNSLSPGTSTTVPDPKAGPTASPKPPAGATTAGATSGGSAPGAPPAVPPGVPMDQQKAMQAQIEARKKLMDENGKKAEKATKSAIAGVQGTYHNDIDESKIAANIKAQPGYASQLAKLKAMTVVVGKDGSVTFKDFPGAVKDVTGVSSKIDGKPVFVLTNPTPDKGGPPKLFVEVKVSDGGGTIKFGQFSFKRA